MPAVSVVIPTHNRARFITRALRSALAQSFGDFEIIVVDDGSRDDTVSVVSKLRDPRISILQHSANRGAQAARNTGIRAARGQYVGFLDSDDEWPPNKLERQLAIFERCGARVGVVHGGCVSRKDEHSPPQDMAVPALRGDVYRQLLSLPGPLFPMMLVRRNCLAAIGYLDESILAYQEWDTAIRLAQRFEFEWVPDVLMIYHRDAHDAISRNWLRAAEGYLQVVSTHRAEIVARCGLRTVSHHYYVAAKHYVLAGRMDLARRWHRRALAANPLNLRALIGYLLTPLGQRSYLRMTAALNTLKPRPVAAERRGPP